MVSLRPFALLTALLLTSGCQSAEQLQDFTPLFDASSPVTAQPVMPVAPGTSPVGSTTPTVQTPTSQTPTAPRVDAGVSDAGGTLVVLPADAAAPSDAAAAQDAAVISMIGDAAIISDAAIVTDAAVVSDAALTDAAVVSDASKPTPSTGTCGGSTPHGCWPPKAGNPMGCPAQIHEQSEYYPPLDEWVDCASPYYERCLYLKPDGSEAYCACDLGVHWLCVY